jgi:hypothetical protein
VQDVAAPAASAVTGQVTVPVLVPATAMALIDTFPVFVTA